MEKKANIPSDSNDHLRNNFFFRHFFNYKNINAMAASDQYPIGGTDGKTIANEGIRKESQSITKYSNEGKSKDYFEFGKRKEKFWLW